MSEVSFNNQKLLNVKERQERVAGFTVQSPEHKASAASVCSYRKSKPSSDCQTLFRIRADGEVLQGGVGARACNRVRQGHKKISSLTESVLRASVLSFFFSPPGYVKLILTLFLKGIWSR